VNLHKPRKYHYEPKHEFWKIELEKALNTTNPRISAGPEDKLPTSMIQAIYESKDGIEWWLRAEIELIRLMERHCFRNPTKE